MPLRHPFQKLCIIPSSNEDRSILLGASGCTINSISFPEGKILYQWPLQQDDSKEDEIEEDSTRPSKRRKLDANGHEPISSQQSEVSDASIEIVAERKKGERKKSKFIDTRLPNVSHLLVTSDGNHVVAVTAEDKAIRVFSINNRGKLLQLSQRSLPKKLCALCLTKDEKTILAADKFGDVYAVPLYQTEGWTPRQKPQAETTFKPAATELTVHTKGNRDALRQQLDHRQQSTKKEGPDFEHKLLLGHVSLLTDLTVAESIVDGKSRPFILTSDRDEHIRVSRGIPQAHVIENFCLGHTEFVTRMCIPPLRPEFLIAGNGEVSLRLYDWFHGTLVQKVLLRQSLMSEFAAGCQSEGFNNGNELPEYRSWERLAVSGIWPIDFSTSTDQDGGAPENLVLVAFEGFPLLMGYVISKDGLRATSTIRFRGNVLDIAVIESTRQLLVSIDNVHKSACMKTYRDDTTSADLSLQLLDIDTSQMHSTRKGTFSHNFVNLPSGFIEVGNSLPEAPPLPEDDPGKSKAYPKTFSALGEFLYGLENLRKKRDITAEEGVEMDAEEIEDLKLNEPTES